MIFNLTNMHNFIVISYKSWNDQVIINKILIIKLMINSFKPSSSKILKEKSTPSFKLNKSVTYSVPPSSHNLSNWSSEFAFVSAKKYIKSKSYSNLYSFNSTYIPKLHSFIPNIIPQIIFPFKFLSTQITFIFIRV